MTGVERRVSWYALARMHFPAAVNKKAHDLGENLLLLQTFSGRQKQDLNVREQTTAFRASSLTKVN